MFRVEQRQTENSENSSQAVKGLDEVYPDSGSNCFPLLTNLLDRKPFSGSQKSVLLLEMGSLHPQSR